MSGAPHVRALHSIHAMMVQACRQHDSISPGVPKPQGIPEEEIPGSSVMQLFTRSLVQLACAHWQAPKRQSARAWETHAQRTLSETLHSTNLLVAPHLGTQAATQRGVNAAEPFCRSKCPPIAGPCAACIAETLFSLSRHGTPCRWAEGPALPASQTVALLCSLLGRQDPSSALRPAEEAARVRATANYCCMLQLPSTPPSSNAALPYTQNPAPCCLWRSAGNNVPQTTGGPRQTNSCIGT